MCDCILAQVSTPPSSYSPSPFRPNGRSPGGLPPSPRPDAGPRDPLHEDAHRRGTCSTTTHHGHGAP
eukprot:9210283-Heterocapsa_arctica.AAC.1